MAMLCGDQGTIRKPVRSSEKCLPDTAVDSCARFGQQEPSLRGRHSSLRVRPKEECYESAQLQGFRVLKERLCLDKSPLTRWFPLRSKVLPSDRGDASHCCPACKKLRSARFPPAPAIPRL